MKLSPACLFSRVRFFHRLAVALAALLAPATAAFAQGGYVFTKIVDNQTARPDGLGTFYLGTILTAPALDGNTVVFQDVASNDNSLWSANASNGTSLTRLVDFRTAVPGGVGAFSRLNDQTALPKDGLVIFEGLDSVATDPGHHLHGGIYTVPTGGGAVSKVVDYHTAAPAADGPFIAANGGNMLTAGFNDGDLDYEAGVIAFHGLTDNNGDGLYSVRLDGTALTRLADKTTEGTPRPFPVGQYFTAALHHHLAVFHGGTVFGSYGLFSSPETGGLSSPTLLATPYTALPGGQSPEQTTVYFTGFSRFDHVTGKYVFAAHDGSGVNGLYSLPADALGGGTISKVVDNQTDLPGGSARASYFDGNLFSADSGQVAFVTATNESAGQVGALYVANASGTLTRVIGAGDVLDGISLIGITLGSHALSGGRIAFGAGSYLQGHDGNPRYGAIFVATPVAMTGDLALTLNASASPAAVGQTVTYTVNVVNNGPAAVPSFTVADTLPAGMTLVSTGSTASTAGNVVTFQAGALAVGAGASFGLVARVDAAGALVNTATAVGSIPDANLANNTAQQTVTATASPVITLAATVPSVTFGSGFIGQFTLTLTSAASTDLHVAYSVKGTGINGTDYVFLKGTAKVKAGKMSKVIKVTPLGNGGGAAKKTVKVTLLPGDGYTVDTAAGVKVKLLAPVP